MDLRVLPYRYVGYSSAILEAIKFMIHPHLMDLAKGATIGYAVLDIMIGLKSNVNFEKLLKFLCSTYYYFIGK